MEKIRFSIFTFIYVLIVMLILVSLSCDKSSEPKDPINLPPSIPAIDTQAGAPPDGSTGRSVLPVLAWTCDDRDKDPLTYDLYFGVATDTVPPLVGENWTTMSYEPDSLEYEMMYAWQVVVRDDHNHQCISPEWTFTTTAYVDEIPPSVSITAPLNGATLTGLVDITADASDNEGVILVEFFIDDTSYFADPAEPFVYTWNTDLSPDSSTHTLFAVACDATGNCDTSDIITVLVDHDTNPPVVSFIAPLDGDTISDTTMIIVDAVDDSAMGYVDIYVDNSFHCSDSSAPYQCELYASDYADGTVITLDAQAYDWRGNTSGTDSILITVRNYNLPPQTTLTLDDYYINAVDDQSPYPGLILVWGGDDPDNDLPLEFEWRLYGPFDYDSTLYTTFIEECIYDPVGDSMVCQDVEVLDIDALPPAIGDLPQPLRQSQGTDMVWTPDYGAILYDLFNGLNLTESGLYKFAFSVRARDSWGMVDQSQAFAQFLVVNALHEKGVAVFDETGYTDRVGYWAPVDLDTAKSFFYEIIRNSIDPDFDTIATGDYYFKFNKKNRAQEYVEPVWPDMITAYRYKTIIYFNDDTAGGPDEGPFGFVAHLFPALDAGTSVWLMYRNAGNCIYPDTPRTIYNKSAAFRDYFGIESIMAEAWFTEAFNIGFFNEQFIGAEELSKDYGPLDIDSALLQTLYPRFFADEFHVFTALPEIGTATLTQYAVPVYTYRSVHGDTSMFHGGVCAANLDFIGRKSACWLFTPLAIDQAQMQPVFDAMMDWLMATPKSDSPSSRAIRRERIIRYLHNLSVYASEQEKVQLGIKISPFQLHQGTRR